MPKPTNAVELVKKAAVEAVDASKPVHILFGTVISASPLKIQVDQKAIYTEKMLVLARNVTDYEVDMTVSHQTVTISHGHPLQILIPGAAPLKMLTTTTPSKGGRSSKSTTPLWLGIRWLWPEFKRARNSWCWIGLRRTRP